MGCHLPGVLEQFGETLGMMELWGVTSLGDGAFGGDGAMGHLVLG